MSHYSSVDRAQDSFATLLGLYKEPWMAQALNGGSHGTAQPCVARLVRYLWELPEGRVAAAEYEKLAALLPGYKRLMAACDRKGGRRRVVYAVALAGQGRKLLPAQIDTAVKAVLRLIDAENAR